MCVFGLVLAGGVQTLVVVMVKAVTMAMVIAGQSVWGVGGGEGDGGDGGYGDGERGRWRWR